MTSSSSRSRILVIFSVIHLRELSVSDTAVAAGKGWEYVLLQDACLHFADIDLPVEFWRKFGRLQKLPLSRVHVDCLESAGIGWLFAVCEVTVEVFSSVINVRVAGLVQSAVCRVQGRKKFGVVGWCTQ
jgi:hypothetical protein